LFLTLLAILVLALLLSLGNWQLDRAQEKQNILNLQSLRMNLMPVDILTVDINHTSLRYLPVNINGLMDVEHQILIDNQVKNGRVGYFVLTPVRLKDSTSILLNRGWVPLGNTRTVLPNINLNAENISVVGKLDNFPSVGIKLEGSDQLTEGWPAITQVIDIKLVEKRLGYAVLPYQVLLNTDQPYGYDRKWVPMKMGPEKHHGYAFQWYALAFAWIVIYFVLTVKIRRN
jgi:surfeit locus 1 family protein